MTEKEILELASGAGFDKVALIDTADIVFNFEYRKACEANVCGNFNACYSCPPDCGSCGDMKDKVLAHKKALVFQKTSDLTVKGVNAKAAKKEHSDMSAQLIEKLNANGVNGGIRVGASCCDCCAVCAKRTGEPCRFPEKAFSCMSAYCIDCEKLAEKCGMSFGWNKTEVSFYGMYIFD